MNIVSPGGPVSYPQPQSGNNKEQRHMKTVNDPEDERFVRGLGDTVAVDDKGNTEGLFIFIFY